MTFVEISNAKYRFYLRLFNTKIPARAFLIQGRRLFTQRHLLIAPYNIPFNICHVFYKTYLRLLLGCFNLMPSTLEIASSSKICSGCSSVMLSSSHTVRHFHKMTQCIHFIQQVFLLSKQTSNWQRKY